MYMMGFLWHFKYKTSNCYDTTFYLEQKLELTYTVHIEFF